MRKEYSTILLMILVALMIVITGTVGSVADSGHHMGINASAAPLLSIHLPGAAGFTPAYDLTVNNIFVALAASAEGSGYYTPHVPRARGQLYQNENRNDIIKFIAENPGYTMSDIARQLGMNIGTARYHLMILSINHLVVEFSDGKRLVRYFANNGSYSEEQMKAISLLRREPVSRLLGVLAGSEGMSNSGISAASGLSYSEVNRYLKELVAGGVVIKEPLSARKSIYRIAPGMEKYVIGYQGIS